MPLRVLIVDDSASVRVSLSRIVDAADDMEVMATAADPYKAADAIRREIPDVIVLDIAMPRMDGLTFLRRLMAQKPMPVLICSSLTQKGSDKAVEAMRAGAADVIAKPDLSSAAAAEESAVILTDKIRAVAQTKPAHQTSPQRQDSRVEAPRSKHTADAVLPARTTAVAGRVEPVVVIGASTGGTEAVEALFSMLTPEVPGIVVVQHLPQRFTGAFARRLDAASPIAVREAGTGETVIAGTALIAPGDWHLALQKRGTHLVTSLMEGPLVSRHRPAVDVLFRSAAQMAGPMALGVLMTGMGDDGARGLLEMRQAGASTVVQSQESCVVYGMPAEAVQRDGAERVADIAGIAALIRSFGARSASQAAAVLPS